MKKKKHLSALDKLVGAILLFIRAETDINFYYPDNLNKIFLDILWIVISSLAIKMLYIVNILVLVL